MSMAFHLKLIQPKELPKDTLTSAEFKPWTNHLINFLQQDVNNFLYLPGGIYEKWLPADEVVANMRIAQLDDNDDDLDAIAAGADNANEKTRKKRVLLKTRNAQLGRMIQHIVSFVHYNEANDIDKSSKSVEWIFKYLRQHYNIEPKGANFLRITEQTYKSGMLPQVFYKQFKASFVENLRKKGETLNHKGGKVLAEDEVLTPSFEDAIILWALEKIDVRLPQKVRRDYEHRLSGGTYLIDLQVTIFQSIPTMIEELNKQAEVNALTTTDDAQINAVRSYQGSRGGGSRGGGNRGRGGQGTERRPWSKNFCRVCHTAGKSPTIYQSHNTSYCSSFNTRERKDMYASLRAMELDGVDDEEEDEEEDGWTVGKEELEVDKK